MTKYTHITESAVSIYARRANRVRTMCGRYASWMNTMEAGDVAAGGEVSPFLAPLCPKCAAALLIASTVEA